MTGMDRATFLRRVGGAAALGALAGTGGLGAALGQSRGGRRPPLSELGRATAGVLITRGSGGYRAAQREVNSRYSGVRPLAILRARNVSDVRAAVRWCSKYDVRIAARSGGHSYAGYSTVQGGLIVDLSRLAGIRVAPGGKTVQVGSGNRLIDMYSALASRGLTVPAGSCPTVGVGGLALGGGVGLAGRALGTTSDNVRSLTVVTADGEAVTANARRNEDLYWACRGGGGGNFGIVTDFTFTTHAVRTASYFFAGFDWDDVGDVVARWQRWGPNAPPELFSLCALETGSGGPTLNVFGQYMGSSGALRRVLAGLTSAARPRSLQVGSARYMDLILRWAGCLSESPAQCRRPPYEPFAAKSSYVLSPVSARGIATMASWIERRQAQSSLGSGAILLDSYGGAINDVPADATAFVHRNALYSCQFAAYWGGGSGAQSAALSWIRGFYRAMAPFVSRYAYQNYIDPDLTTWRTAYYGANLARLIDVKRQYDPDDLFRFRQSIPA
jgi:FAD/FMN-containing dehydrogenase